MLPVHLSTFDEVEYCANVTLEYCANVTLESCDNVTLECCDNVLQLQILLLCNQFQKQIITFTIIIVKVVTYKFCGNV